MNKSEPTMTKQKAAELLVGPRQRTNSAVYLEFAEQRLNPGFESPEEILWLFSAALLYIFEEREQDRKQRKRRDAVPERREKAKSAAVGK